MGTLKGTSDTNIETYIQGKVKLAYINVWVHLFSKFLRVPKAHFGRDLIEITVIPVDEYQEDQVLGRPCDILKWCEGIYVIISCYYERYNI
jgi:hypothetical protein